MMSKMAELDLRNTFLVAARQDSGTLSSGDQDYPAGTPTEIFNEVIGPKIPVLPGHPSYMNTRDCGKFLRDYIIAAAKRIGLKFP